MKDQPLPPAPPPNRLATAALDHKVVGYLLEAHGRGRLELAPGIAKALRAQRAIEALQGAIRRRARNPLQRLGEWTQRARSLVASARA